MYIRVENILNEDRKSSEACAAGAAFFSILMLMEGKLSKQKIALNYFIKHQKELCKRFFGKELLLSGRKIIAAFDSLGEAVETGEQKFGPGNYSVYKCLPGDSAYSINVPLFHAFK